MQRTLIFAIFLLTTAAFGQKKVEEYFHFDQPDETVKATLLENPLFYDAGIAPSSNGLWVAWLEFIPGKGDQLWVGLRKNERWVSKRLVSDKPSDFANPTPTVDSVERLWLSYEQTNSTTWETIIRPLNRDPSNPSTVELKNFRFWGINHRVTADPKSGVLLLGQAAAAGRFKTFGAPVGGSGAEPNFSFVDSENVWHPSATITPDGQFHFIWDSYDGNSYNVFFATGNKGALASVPLAASDAFEAHAQIASDKNGKLFVLWEEDGENWGKHYLARTPGDKKSTRMTDNEGPLHRFRKLHFAELDEKKGELKEYELPQPSFELANKRTDAPPGLKNFGAFYENGQLVIDGQNRPWIVYRHFYVPWIGVVPETHKQDNMRVYARCLLPGGWSKLFSFSEGQGDGMQRINVAPLNGGISVAYTVGRTDRRQKDEKNERRGVALAEIHLEKNEVKVPVKFESKTLPKLPSVQAVVRSRSTTELAGKKYELFFGDMHRHTDISLCYSPCDGTIEDAYRYAIDAAPLDFLGITDHTHDLDWGNGLALIWHRSRKEVNRHALAGKFIPLFSYERSRADTDHNVFSLNDNILKPHTFALTEFWKQIDTNTFTVAHQPFNPVTWSYHDDVHRPLLEIYQGYRNDAREEDAKQALLRGNHVGFISASDHLSTGGSFACIWAERADRETLFRAMQARRTYAATAQINLKVTCGDHWMGERFELEKMKAITVKVTPTAKISALELFIDGESKVSAVDQLQGAPSSETTWEIPGDPSLTGPHIFHVRLTQADGNRAWSSPLWVDIKK